MATMAVTDINCDMGEGIGNDAALMPFISSANIACGYHAGDAATMRQTAELAMAHGVSVGAHPSYPDKENFGRSPMALPPPEVYRIVTAQVKAMQAVCADCGAVMRHVKPHGALYNIAAKDLPTALAIATAVKDCGSRLVLYGLPGSCMQAAAEASGIAFCGEAFADRSYQPDGTLTPRDVPGALLADTAAVVAQVLQLLQAKTVTTLSGVELPVAAATICIHGDGPHAPAFAAAIHAALGRAGITIKAI